MNYKYSAVIDKDGYYVTYVRVHFETDEGGEVIERIDSYVLAEGERLIDAQAPSGMAKPRWNGTGWEETGTREITPEMIEQMRANKLIELGSACEQVIFAGIELGGKRYALTTNDQVNIQNLALQIQAGAQTVLYHADGELCGPYSAEAIMALMEAAVRHVTYHTTYCNHLLVWARRAKTDELDGIVYGAPLPEDLQQNLDALLAAMGGA